MQNRNVSDKFFPILQSRKALILSARNMSSVIKVNDFRDLGLATEIIDFSNDSDYSKFS